jgi:hypothetical protein
MVHVPARPGHGTGFDEITHTSAAHHRHTEFHFILHISYLKQEANLYIDIPLYKFEVIRYLLPVNVVKY